MFPWDGLTLQIEEVPSPVHPNKFFYSLSEVDGVFAGASLDPFIPDRWSRFEWQYIALIMGPDNQRVLDRLFVGKSARKKGKLHSSRYRGFDVKLDLPLLPEGSLVEIRSGDGSARKEEVFQRIYRKDIDGWFHVAYRQEDRGGTVDPAMSSAPSVRKYNYQRFYPWCLILGIVD